MRQMRIALLVVTCLLTGCAGTTASLAPAPPSEQAAPTLDATPSSTPSPPSPSPSPSGQGAPPQLYGTWRTTLGGTPVTLTLRPDDTYRIHRGVSAGTGDIRIDGDRIDFFNSTLCQGTGEYRWQIEGDSLRFSSLTEPCPGRAEALLNVRYGDYSPPG